MIQGRIEGKSVEGQRKVRSDKKIRVNAPLDADTHKKLKKLAISCNMTKTSLGSDLIKMCVNHPDIIKFYQDQYNDDDQYRVVPIRENNDIHY